jgi:hypothetical protein
MKSCAVAPSSRSIRTLQRMDLLPISSWRRATIADWWNSAPEFLVLCPADVFRRNGTLLYEVNNRGNIAIFRQLNEAPSNNDPATTADARFMER